MKTANIAEIKSHLSEYIHIVEAGEEVQICKRNIPVAILSPIKKAVGNTTKLGCGLGSVKIKTDLTEPVINADDWNMLKGEL